MTGLPRHRAQGEGGAAPGIGVELGEDNPGDAHFFVKGLGYVGRGLAGHRVGHEEGLVGLDRVPDLDELVHHGLVDLEAARGVHDEGVEELVPGLGQGGLGHLDWVGGALLPIDLDPDLGTQDGELLHGRWADEGRRRL